MSQPPVRPPEDDDRDLVSFMRQRRSQPPAAAPDLEDRIMAAIAQSENSNQRRSTRWYRSPWLPTAIAASLVAGVVSYRTLNPAKPSPADLATLESFIETSWDGSLSDDSDDWAIFRSQDANDPVSVSTNSHVLVSSPSTAVLGR